MPSPLESMIDASMVCLCCRKKGIGNCDCAEGVRCGVCHRCATHCREMNRCNAWWWQLADKIERDKETPRSPLPARPTETPT